MYLKGTILNPVRINAQGYNVANYTSVDYVAIHKYTAGLPSSMFDMYQVNDNDKWERIAHELYNNADYWDVLLVVNKRNPLTGLPLDFDAVSIMSDDKAVAYETNTYKEALPNNIFDLMYAEYNKHLTIQNDLNKVIRIVKPTMMSSFLQGGFDAGLF